MSTLLKSQIRKLKCLRLKPYEDPEGQLFIGYGRQLSRTGITIPEAEYLLQNDVTRIGHELSELCPWYAQMQPSPRRDVFTFMAFELSAQFVKHICDTSGITAAIHRQNFDRASNIIGSARFTEHLGRTAFILAEQLRSDTYAGEA